MLSESMSRLALFAFAAVLVSRALGLAACDPTTDPDRSDVANARTTVATNCDCGAAGERRPRQQELRRIREEVRGAFNVRKTGRRRDLLPHDDQGDDVQDQE